MLELLRNRYNRMNTRLIGVGKRGGMYTKKQFRGLTHSVFSRIALVVFGATATITLGWAAQGTVSSVPLSGNPEPNSTESHMSEALRSSVHKVVVIAGESPAGQSVTGSYETGTAGLAGGMEAGSRLGTVTTDIGGVDVNIPIIPGLAIPGAIFGGLTGATQREIQEFRDELTEEIVRAANPPLRSDGLALDVFWGIHKLPNLESQLFAPTVEIPNDTVAILYVSLNDLTIDVQGNEAIITTSATATLRRLSDGRDVYETVLVYQDRDTLGNWTEDENALWRDYTNFARYYLGREISADVFDRIELNHELRPRETDTAEQARKDKRKFSSRSLTPTLAWELTLEGGDSYGSWTDTIDESDIFYDVEIFNNHRLVYHEEQVPGPRHTIAFELDACQTYRWSVRPAYHVDGEIKFGEWMRFSAESDTEKEAKKGIFGKRASEAPAYIQDFALLEIKCSRR